jgi:hypothetical protein
MTNAVETVEEESFTPKCESKRLTDEGGPWRQKFEHKMPFISSVTPSKDLFFPSQRRPLGRKTNRKFEGN